MLENETYTLYKSSTCVRCPLAERSMVAAGVNYDSITLDEPGNEEILADFRAEASGRGFRLEMPIVRTPQDEILTNLATISQHFRELASA